MKSYVNYLFFLSIFTLVHTSFACDSGNIDSEFTSPYEFRFCLNLAGERESVEIYKEEFYNNEFHFKLLERANLKIPAATPSFNDGLPTTSILFDEDGNIYANRIYSFPVVATGGTSETTLIGASEVSSREIYEGAGVANLYFLRIRNQEILDNTGEVVTTKEYFYSSPAFGSSFAFEVSSIVTREFLAHPSTYKIKVEDFYTHNNSLYFNSGKLHILSSGTGDGYNSFINNYEKVSMYAYALSDSNSPEMPVGSLRESAEYTDFLNGDFNFARKAIIKQYRHEYPGNIEERMIELVDTEEEYEATDADSLGLQWVQSGIHYPNHDYFVQGKEYDYELDTFEGYKYSLSKIIYFDYDISFIKRTLKEEFYNWRSYDLGFGRLSREDFYEVNNSNSSDYVKYKDYFYRWLPGSNIESSLDIVRTYLPYQNSFVFYQSQEDLYDFRNDEELLVESVFLNEDYSLNYGLSYFYTTEVTPTGVINLLERSERYVLNQSSGSQREITTIKEYAFQPELLNIRGKVLYQENFSNNTFRFGHIRVYDLANGSFKRKLRYRNANDKPDWRCMLTNSCTLNQFFDIKTVSISRFVR